MVGRGLIWWVEQARRLSGEAAGPPSWRRSGAVSDAPPGARSRPANPPRADTTDHELGWCSACVAVPFGRVGDHGPVRPNRRPALLAGRSVVEP